nr:C25 family cysteine peptidase [Candidatus Krumholzibacteria bacterium]
GDDRFEGTFLNHQLLSTIPTEAAYRGITAEVSQNDKARGGKAGTLLGNLEGRLGVTKTGLFKVSYARLRQLSLLPDVDIAESEIRLYQRRYLSRLDDGSGQAPYVEIEVPLHMVGEGNDFDGDDYFLFYGLRLRDDEGFNVDLGQGPENLQGSGDPHEMNNPANIYWLAASEPEAGQSWARMSTATLPAASSTPLTSYRRTEHHEEQLSFRELQPNTDFDRVFFNNSNDTQVNIGFNPLWSPDPNGSAVEIELAFTGKNDVQRPLEFHLINADNEATLLGNYDVSSLYLSRRETTLPAADFAGPNAKVRMGPRGGDSSDRVYAFINWIDLSYDALYQAVGGRLEFHTGEGAGARPIEVTGFTSSDLGLVDLQDPRNPVWINLSAANVVADGAGWKLSIEPSNPTAAPRTFYAAQDMDGAVVPEFTYSKSSVARDQVNPTELAGAQPDLIVITHDEFADALDGWINHRVARAGGNLNVHVVQVDDLFDWYSGGLRDPWALKRFTTHAINNWGSWALTLVGDANENVLELDVLTSARDWSTDWVPTHYHVQDTGIYNPELMASDKWYATSQSGQTYPVEDFPEFTISPWEMYVGRLPVNSVEELNTMVSKIQAMETLEAGQAWRQRGIFFADDAWSNGYGANAFNFFTYRAYEEDFARSERDSLAPAWASGSPVPLQAVELYLADYLDPYWEGQGQADRPAALFKDYAETDANPPLLAALSQGGIVAHYQGHGNPYVLSSEYWMEDRLGFYRKDVSNLNNAGKPWVFFGMGCHISDWAQNPVYTEGTPRERSLSEKMMVRSGGGAVATYGSSGYEYIDANRIFGEYIFRRWMRHPPVARSVGQPGEHRSRWMVGELMWAAEADLLAVLGGGSTFREMVAQYTLLGDPLMMLDAGEPQVTAELLGTGGGPITGEVDLVAIDPGNQRVIEINARDEAGIDRLEVVDDQGNDLTSQIVLAEMLPGATDHQEMNYTLTVPIVPRDHVLTVRVHDTAGPLPTDRHYELVLNLRQEAEFQAGGEIIDPATYVFAPDEPVAFSATVTASTWFHDGMALDLTSPNLDLSDVNFDLGKSNELTFSFTAEAPAGTSGDRSVTLVVDTYETVYTLQEAGAQLPLSTITAVFNYPNPMR